MNAEVRQVWERHMGTIGAKWTEEFVAQVVDELVQAASTHFRCPVCKAHFGLHTQQQTEMVERHLQAHLERIRPNLAYLSIADRQALCGESGR